MRTNTDVSQLIEIWETFLMQLDAEDDEHAYYRPPVQQQFATGSGEQGDGRLSGETQVAASSIATTEDD